MLYKNIGKYYQFPVRNRQPDLDMHAFHEIPTLLPHSVCTTIESIQYFPGNKKLLTCTNDILFLKCILQTIT